MRLGAAPGRRRAVPCRASARLSLPLSCAADIQLVPVDSAGNLVASAVLGEKLLASAWVNPADNRLITAQLQSA